MTTRITEEQIREHTQLLNSLSALDYVPTAQEDNNARLSEVTEEVAARERILAGLRSKTKSEREDVEKLNSSVRRMFIRIRGGGKEALTQRVEKEQTEHLEAWKRERQAEEELEILLQEKKDREQTRDDLAEKSRKREECQAKIDELYQGLFAGPTPDHPEEEAVESRLRTAENDYTQGQVALNAETKALIELIKTEKGLNKLIAKLRDAQNRFTQYPFGRSEWEDTITKIHVSSAGLDLTMCSSCLRKAEQFVGPGVIGSIGMAQIVNPEYDQDIIGGRWVMVPVAGFEERLAKNVQEFQQCHMRVSGEIDKSNARIQDYRSRLKHYARSMTSIRKELAEVRCGIMIHMTDPATVQPMTHRTAPNAIEFGDTELPTYTEPSQKNVAHSNTENLNRAASRSIAVPTYEQAQEQNRPAGGFRMTLEGGRAQVPAHAPPGIGPAPGPGGIGGFRGMTVDNSPAIPSLSLKIPEPKVNGVSTNQLGSPLLSPNSPLTPGGSPTLGGPSTSRPTSWSVNPYAGAMIRKASQSDEPAVPGRWSSTNPYIELITEEPKDGSE
ncbi:hypothetical protein RhiJN_28327 [Ceratobasidium sp. AG-Ba]|nr:hypothetical protein RhiJN_28327 [Ceratobasidium sp. AG-Ba]